MHSLLPFLYLFLVGTKGAGGSDHTLPLMEYLDHNHLVCLKWGFDNQQGYITFKLAVNTTGWVGFGLSPNGNMIGADIVIGGVGPNGSYFKVSTCVAVCFIFPPYLYNFKYYGKNVNNNAIDQDQAFCCLKVSSFCFLGLSCHRGIHAFGR